MGHGTFQALHEGVIPPQQTSATVSTGELPERVALVFRLIAQPGYRTSNEVQFRRGIRPPASPSVWRDAQGFWLTWSNLSALATTAIVERRVRRCSTDEEWAEIATVPASGPYVDSDLSSWTDGAGYEYRVSVVWTGSSPGQTERSAPLSPVASSWAPLIEPTFTAIEPLTGAARLAFANRSTCATELVVLRAQYSSDFVASELARLPTSAIEYTDTSAAPGRWSYRLQARRVYPGGQVNASREAMRDGLVGPPASWGFAFSPLLVPAGRILVRASSGTFASAAHLGGHPGEVPQFRAPGDSSPVLTAETGARAFFPALVMGPDGRPHCVYVRPADPLTGLSPIDHAWHDGTRWQTEEIARRVLSGGDGTQLVRVAMGVDGTLHASWQAGPDASLGLEVASRRADGWELVNLASALGPDAHVRWPDHVLAADAAGGPHVFVADWTLSMRHIRRDQGAWTIDVIPDVRAETMWHEDPMFKAVAGDGWIALAYVDPDSSQPTHPLKLVTWTDAGWTAPETLAQLDWNLGYPPQVASSADGSRFAVLARVVEAGGGDGRVFVRGAGAPAELQFSWIPYVTAFGFRPDGKIWVVSGSAELTPGAESADVPAALLEEP